MRPFNKFRCIQGAHPNIPPCAPFGLNAYLMHIPRRQIFIHQPNRWFVRGLILSQKRAQLVQFDRAGTQLSAFCDIHTDPHIFVGMLLGLTTTADDRAYLGLDDSLSWAHDRKGRKESGTLKTLSPQGLKVLQLVDIHPILLHRHIRGSGTVCWKAKDTASKAVYLVKDSWSSKGRTPEWQLLIRANNKGIKGVCKMAWYEKDVVDVSRFRCASTVNDFFHRTASRVVIEISGEELDKFKTKSQAIRALRDVIAGKSERLYLNALRPCSPLIPRQHTGISMEGGFSTEPFPTRPSSSGTRTPRSETRASS